MDLKASSGFVLKVMTFNLRFDNPQDGLHGWPFRKERVVDTVLSEGPDLLATQEGMPSQLAYLSERLKGYRPSLHGRTQEEDGFAQYPTIFFRVHSLAPRGGGEFWLSETPHLSRTKSWGAAFPRLFTYGCFQHRSAHRSVWFCNTHLDHVSERARLEGAKLILGWARRKRLPIILAGDFNDVPDSLLYRVLTSGQPSLIDTWRVVKGSKAMGPSTIHHFTGKPAGGRIDWILTTPGVRVEEARVLRGAAGEPLASDHYPYVATLIIY